jgi:hypothetical protein
MKASKMTRAQSIEIAQQARKVPQGEVSRQYQARLPTETADKFKALDPIERGRVIELGAAFEAKGYLLIYDILDQLGSPVISTIVDAPMEMICRHKTYKGDNQSELLLEILRDRLENFNYLTPGGLDDEPRITD